MELSIYRKIKIKGGAILNDKFTKVILAGILICLIVIACKSTKSQVVTSNPSFNVNEGEQVIQLAPNKIAVADTRIVSGSHGTILVFEYDNNNKKFNYVGSMNYADYFRNPNKYGITTEAQSK